MGGSGGSHIGFLWEDQTNQNLVATVMVESGDISSPNPQHIPCTYLPFFSPMVSTVISQGVRQCQFTEHLLYVQHYMFSPTPPVL